jgi:hypothetical protein
MQKKKIDTVLVVQYILFNSIQIIIFMDKETKNNNFTLLK